MCSHPGWKSVYIAPSDTFSMSELSSQKLRVSEFTTHSNSEIIFNDVI